MKLSALDKLKEKREKLDKRIQSVEARSKETDRKKDIRRKILVGSYYLEQAKNNKTIHELNQLMDTFLTRTSDRVLFDLSVPDKNKTLKGSELDS
jgi:hypothetical protein